MEVTLRLRPVAVLPRRLALAVQADDVVRRRVRRQVEFALDRRRGGPEPPTNRRDRQPGRGRLVVRWPGSASSVCRLDPT
jgi:hypothetical protein